MANDLLSDLNGGIMPEELEAILESLTGGLGSSFKVNEPGITDDEKVQLISWTKMYCIARCIYELWLASEESKNSTDPYRMTNDFINRWLVFLNIPVLATDSIEIKKTKIQELFLRWTTPPTESNIRDKLIDLVSEIFVELDLDQPGKIGVRVWLPSDHNGNELITEGEFYNKTNLYNRFLSDYLPTYTVFNTYRFSTPMDGTITVASGATTVTGTGTFFTTLFSNGSIFESVDDNNILQTYVVDSVTSDTELELAEGAPSNNTNGIVRTTGFKLDSTFNLNNQVLN